VLTIVSNNCAAFTKNNHANINFHPFFAATKHCFFCRSPQHHFYACWWSNSTKRIRLYFSISQRTFGKL